MASRDDPSGRDAPGTAGDDPVCPLCLRPIPPGVPQSLHHLVPRLKGGARGPVVRLHQICHREIHARFSEADLARRLSSIAALRAAPELADFLVWIARRPPGFLGKGTGPPAAALKAPRRAAKNLPDG